MRKVVILALENCVLSTIAAPMDLFLQAGVMWNLTLGEKPDPLFEVKIVTSNGREIRAINQIPVIPACSMLDIEEADLIIIPSQAFFFDPRSKKHHERVEWLRNRYEKGADIASICTGAFTLASTGLLDGRDATTHWAMAKKFRESFPAVNLRIDLMITDEGRLFCGGGITADLSLSLYLIRKYCGREIALQSARCTLVELDRITQLPFAVFNPEKNHYDNEILEIQERMEENLRSDVNLEELATNMGISLRQFNRRFKSATGESGIRYLQLMRIEAAKLDLVGTKKPFEEISLDVGYENVSFFRRIFIRETGVTPGVYRQKFRQY